MAEKNDHPGTEPKRRAPHKKVRTGCVTCKIRRVRCDEGKPECHRCLSTGRKCDGYAPASGSTKRDTADSHLAADSRLVLPPKNLEEIRSYRFFMEVTAPAIATTFDSEFWRLELPRICQSDPAIWHAAVSFGCVHENYLSASPDQHAKSTFAVQQFNASVKCLTAPTYTDRWRALVVSAIFTCVCHFEGLQDHARIHLRAGYKLLQEIQKEEDARWNRKSRSSSSSESAASISPISLSSISSILTGFQISDQALSRGGISDMPMLISRHDSFTEWRTYTAPSKTPYLTVENLTQASRASESLLNGLVFFMQRHANQIKDIFLGTGDVGLMESIALKQEPEIRCFAEISRAIQSFQNEVDARETEASDYLADSWVNKTLLTLKLYQGTNRFILLKDPDEPDLVKRHEGLPAAGMRLAELAEEILNLGGESHDKPLVPSPPTSTPLFILAHSGLTQEIRRRAIKLLKRPKMVGMWDTVLSARIGEAIMEREKSAAYEDQLRRVEEGTLALEMMERDADSPVKPLHRIFNMTLVIEGKRRARLSLRTWQDWIRGQAGEQRVTEW
ncbi:Zn(2)-C6 fungal-type domain-containing protein [Fusarium falciforme]|uniref:Zn(2)-C6 fungal-type domain-containing protein n=1 Tax=Fusarium falciforme TaxID=195108 RepID=UPI002301DFF7|nr:Zn(2)-C6 fungal-type domain-containing protein [Fusarium falciforme]WAO97384.1 Zn(2)-C6 fungal-type domain-containing protein [Fusarium falciforme]